MSLRASVGSGGEIYIYMNQSTRNAMLRHPHPNMQSLGGKTQF